MRERDARPPDRATRALAKLGGLNLTHERAARASSRIIITGLRHLLARRAGRRVPARGAAPASRSRSSTPPSSATATRSSTRARSCIAISQSGETADTLAAMREAKRKGARGARHRATWSARPSRARPTAASTSTPAPRSAWPRPRRSPARSTVLALLTLHAGPAARPCRAEHGQRDRRASSTRMPEQDRARSSPARDDDPRRSPSAYADARQLPVPRARLQLPGRARGRAEAQGDLLHPRRGLPGGRDEARPHRADRREHAGGVHRARATAAYDKVDEQHAGGAGARTGAIIAVATEGDTEIAARADHVIYDPARRSTCCTPLLSVDPAAAAGLPHRRAARLRRGPAAQPGQERHGGVRPRRRRRMRSPPVSRPAIAAGARRRSARTARRRSCGCTAANRVVFTSGQVGLDPGERRSWRRAAIAGSRPAQALAQPRRGARGRRVAARGRGEDHRLPGRHGGLRGHERGLRRRRSASAPPARTTVAGGGLPKGAPSRSRRSRSARRL